MKFADFESPPILNSPNLSLFPLLAYHKICNDHYRNEKWQPFEPWTCNIDYLRPTDNMNAKSFISSSTFTSLMTSIIDLENSNLPIDYFTSVLPRAQYGDESAAIVSGGQGNSTFTFDHSSHRSEGALFDGSNHSVEDELRKDNEVPTQVGSYYAFGIQALNTQSFLHGFSGKLDTSSFSVKLSALLS